MVPYSEVCQRLAFHPLVANRRASGVSLQIYQGMSLTSYYATLPTVKTP